MRRFSVLFVVAMAAVVCVGATPPFDWGLPVGVAPPPVPLDNPMNAAKVELGRRLFYDTGLSANGTVACATCHEQARGFAVAERTRPGVHGGPGRRNPMGLANVGYLSPLTWADPTARTLESQVATPLFGDKPVEMGMAADAAELVSRLSADSCYRQAFAAAFPEERGTISTETTSKALAAFQRTLISWNAPYDREHRGEAGAMPAQAKAGEAVFAALGCTQCHSGPNFTDGEMHQSVAPFGDDEGAVEKTGREQDRGFFRTPSLRNVALTAPYLHDGRAESLRDAVVSHPADLQISTADMAALETFLGSLTDQTFATETRFGQPTNFCGKPRQG